jgi:hypothetical protein
MTHLEPHQPRLVSSFIFSQIVCRFDPMSHPQVESRLPELKNASSDLVHLPMIVSGDCSHQCQVSAASTSLSTIASSVTAAVGESNIQAASATVSSLGAKTRGAMSSTVTFLEEKGVVSGAQGLVASAGATAKSVFAFAQSGVRAGSFYFDYIF